MWISIIIAFILGICFGIALAALLSANNKDDIECAMMNSYKEGYEKGFNDGYELKKDHIG